MVIKLWKRKLKNEIPSYMKVEFNHKIDTNPEHTHIIKKIKKTLGSFSTHHIGSKSMSQLKRRIKLYK